MHNDYKIIILCSFDIMKQQRHLQGKINTLIIILFK